MPEGVLLHPPPLALGFIASYGEISIQQLAGERSASPLELCQTVKSCQTTYSVSALPPACLAQSRADGRKPARRPDRTSVSSRVAGRGHT
jgi:hypothetical protein